MKKIRPMNNSTKKLHLTHIENTQVLYTCVDTLTQKLAEQKTSRWYHKFYNIVGFTLHYC